ncbi:hypothetical protein N0V93_002702 [Gnomoniopsis smithogilvyi]|uniref:FAD dependent oxidoreductase domain-containing protein n=1 Tax=Gnomoniopsis smithogilvyi TaxID=1191159 RepID=A0A9W9CXW9_9PEZI|nr:hypothetical protein N0V93_002702 [Gnomoniopsis smithogilvyi]
MSPITSDSDTNLPSFSSSSPSTTSVTQKSPPTSILIIGAGVFGLSTALSLATRPEFTSTSITIVDRSPTPGVFPARDASSIDTSRIIRADYADPAYAALADEAQAAWRQQDHPDDLGAQGRYSETGLMLVGDAVLGARHGGGEGQKTGLDYVHSSYANVRALHPGSDKITALPSATAIRDAYGTGGFSGSWGYINRLSGWANAEASMAWLYRRAVATKRITFVNGTVTSLLRSPTDNNHITGVQLSDGVTISARLTVLATGAWTPSLINLSGRAVATGQVIAYLPLTPAEQAKLANVPTLLNLSTGYFIITPSANTLKIARHAYGYLNPVSAPNGDTLSTPMTHLTHPTAPTLVPKTEQAAMRAALRQMVPWPELAERPFSSTRLCWYTDTPDGDFIIDYHPEHKGLFVATGASGHGFKFLPCIGEKIVDCILGECPGAFKEKWSFKKGNEVKRWDQVVTEDGSRGGVPGLILGDELREERREGISSRL